MPFLNESGSVTITPANVDFIKQEGGRSRLRPSSHNSSGSSAYSTNSLSSQLALQAQRRAAQRKLQMAKMMGNGNMAALMKFERGHYSAAESQNDAFVANRRNRSNNFSLKETFNLLKIWASPEMQWQMKHNFRNFRVWEAISYQMHEMGHERTAIQCKNRIQNLTSIYYRIKKSGQDPRTFNFPYYKIIGDVLDVKKSGSSSITPPPGVMSNGAFSMSSANVSPSSSSQNNSSGLAAHLALVAEYQDLVNGHPDGYMTPNSSLLGTSGMSVLSPEVSLSEGNSPIRMESQGRSSAAASSHKANGMRGPHSSSRTIVKSDPDAVTVSVDDASGAENEDDTDYTDQTYGDNDDEGTTEGYPPSTRTNKRSLSAPYATGRSTGGNPAKRPRVGSSSAASASGVAEDPIGHYLAEMVEIEREWLDMERNRAENERQMMMYMMQVLQALVCPQGQEEEESNDENGEEAGADFQGGEENEGESEDAGGSQGEGGVEGGDDGDSDSKQNE